MLHIIRKVFVTGLSELNLPELIMISPPSPWAVLWGRGNPFWCHIENQFWPTAPASCLSGELVTHCMVFISHFSWPFVMCSFLWAGLRSRQGQGAVLGVMDKDTLSIKKITRAPSWVIKGFVSGFSCVVCIVYRVFSTEKHRHSSFGLGGKTSWMAPGHV